jgi:hypothetical protein
LRVGGMQCVHDGATKVPCTAINSAGGRTTQEAEAGRAREYL